VINKHPARLVTVERLKRIYQEIAKASAPPTPDAAIRRIQRFWRVAKRTHFVVNNVSDSSESGNLRMGGKDVICPITQCPIEVADVFRFVCDNGAVVAYSSEYLAGYLVQSGRFKCCLTQTKMNRAVVARLQRKRARLGAPVNLLHAFDNQIAILRRAAEQHNRILAIELDAGDAMIACLNMCSNLSADAATVNAELQNYLIPEWRLCIAQYARIDRESCRAMLVMETEKLRQLQRDAAADPHAIMHLIEHAVRAELNRVQRQATSGFISGRAPREVIFRIPRNNSDFVFYESGSSPIQVTLGNRGPLVANFRSTGSIFGPVLSTSSSESSLASAGFNERS
jgi:hypothetical protein